MTPGFSQIARAARLKRQPVWKSEYVILKRGDDGNIIEKSARPGFLFKSKLGFNNRIILPADYYKRDSEEHIERRKALEAGAD